MDLSWKTTRYFYSVSARLAPGWSGDLFVSTGIAQNFFGTMDKPSAKSSSSANPQKQSATTSKLGGWGWPLEGLQSWRMTVSGYEVFG